MVVHIAAKAIKALEALKTAYELRSHTKETIEALRNKIKDGKQQPNEKVDDKPKTIFSKIKSGCNKAMSVITHPTVSKGLTLTLASVTLAAATAVSGGLALPAAGLALAGVAVGYKTHLEIKEKQELKNIKTENNHLKDFQTSKEISQKITQEHGLDKKLLGINTPEKRSEKDIEQPVQKKASTLKSIGHAIKHHGMEIVLPCVAAGLSGDVPMLAAFVTTGLFAGGAAVVDAKLEKKAKIEMKERISELQKEAPSYNGLHELNKMSLEQKSQAQALENLVARKDFQELKANPDKMKEIFGELKKDAMANIQKSDKSYKNDQLTKPTKFSKFKTYMKDLGNVLNPIKTKKETFKDLVANDNIKREKPEAQLSISTKEIKPEKAKPLKHQKETQEMENTLKKHSKLEKSSSSSLDVKAQSVGQSQSSNQQITR